MAGENREGRWIGEYDNKVHKVVKIGKRYTWISDIYVD